MYLHMLTEGKGPATSAGVDFEHSVADPGFSRQMSSPKVVRQPITWPTLQKLH